MRFQRAENLAAADAPAAASLEVRSARQDAPAAAFPVLVVEDDPVSRQLARKTLEVLGYRAEIACNGAEALAAFEPGKFAAILMDVSMPVMDGVTATREIRRIEAAAGNGNVPILAVTARAMNEDHESCLAAGMNDHIAKPYAKNDLARKLGDLVRNWPAQPDGRHRVMAEKFPAELPPK